MRKLNIILLAVLVVQVAVGAFFYTRPDVAQAEPDKHWVTLDPTKLVSITITDGQGKKLVLQHGKNGWQVPAQYGFPADSQQIKSLVTRLDGVRPDLPVAVSDAAQSRFHVAEDNFERHVVFKTDAGVTADIYIGKSAGAGRLYARLAGSNAIQDIRLPLWRVSVDAKDWLDKGILAFDPDAQKRIELPHVALVRQHDAWTVQHLADDRVPDPGHIQALLYRLRHLQWGTLVGTKEAVTLPPQPTFRMTVTSSQGDKQVYRFYKVTDDKASNGQAKESDEQPIWRVTRTGFDYVVTMSNEHVKDLQQANAKNLSLAKPENKG